MTLDTAAFPRRWDPVPRPADLLDGPDLELIEHDADRLGDAALAGRNLHQGGPRQLDEEGPGFQASGSGRALPIPLQSRLARGFGLDLADVRLHDDAAARAMTQGMDAEAAVSGKDILLGRDADSPGAERLIAHEVAHMAQAGSRPEMPPVLLNGGNGSTGIGASPPAVEFTRSSGQGPEDRHVTFAHNSADLAPATRAALRAIASAQTGPVDVDLYGYASTEGAAEYNINLSAHRAVAVRRLLAPLLPEGSVVRLHAHGETDAFGAPDRNRRVGVDITERAETTETPSQLPGMPRPGPFPRVSLGVGPLTLGGPISPGQIAEPDDEADTGGESTPSPDAEPEVPAARLPSSFTLRFRQPLSPFSPLARSVFGIPPVGGTSPTAGLNYLPFAHRAALHGEFLPDLVERGELESAYRLHRTLYPWIPENTDHIDSWLLRQIAGLVISPITAQSATERGFNAHMESEHPTLLQQSQQQEELLRSQGVIPEAPGLPGPLNLIDGMVFTIIRKEF